MYNMIVRSCRRIVRGKVLWVMILIWYMDGLDYVLEKLDDLADTMILFLVKADDSNVIMVEFLLYKPGTDKTPWVLRMNSTTVNDDYFDCQKETRVIIHGSKSFPTEPWIQEMKDKLLDQTKSNVIVVDWSVTASSNYLKGAANAEVVGEKVAKLTKIIQTKSCANLHSFHLIGKSLGAHVAGFAGQYLGGRLGRITGLDPAGFLFTKRGPEYRLDSTDAAFVDVIHTDIGDLISKTKGAGIRIMIGDVDFYPNGGNEQPGCDKTGEDMWCNHRRSHLLFMATIGENPEKLLAYACADYQTFQSGECSSCGTKGESCAVLGMLAKDYWISGRTRKNVPYFINTASEPPYFT